MAVIGTRRPDRKVAIFEQTDQKRPKMAMLPPVPGRHPKIENEGSTRHVERGSTRHVLENDALYLILPPVQARGHRTLSQRSATSPGHDVNFCTLM
jgi:hypothetical protein